MGVPFACSDHKLSVNKWIVFENFHGQKHVSPSDEPGNQWKKNVKEGGLAIPALKLYYKLIII